MMPRMAGRYCRAGEASKDTGIEDEWLEKHTFYCSCLTCRMTPEYCFFLQVLYAEGEKIPLREWLDACSGRKKLLAFLRRPAACNT